MSSLSIGVKPETSRWRSLGAKMGALKNNDKGILMTAAIYEFEVKTINGETVELGSYENQVMLIVNTASKCGFTPQYEGLEELYAEYKEQGLAVLGFPCNQFGRQEPGSESEIAEFCQLNYGVSFPMFGKIDVNGNDADPLFKYLKKSQKGLLGSEKIKWNFTKFLVNREGEVISRFAPTVKPKDLAKDIESML
jgi:glutathione peroxidase